MKNLTIAESRNDSPYRSASAEEGRVQVPKSLDRGEEVRRNGALKERLEEVDTELGEIGRAIQEALDRTFDEEYTVQDVRITQADHISVLIDLTEPIEENIDGGTWGLFGGPKWWP